MAKYVTRDIDSIGIAQRLGFDPERIIEIQSSLGEAASVVVLTRYGRRIRWVPELESVELSSSPVLDEHDLQWPKVSPVPLVARLRPYSLTEDVT